MIAEQPLEVPLSASGNLSPRRDYGNEPAGEEPTPLEVRGWQHRFD